MDIFESISFIFENRRDTASQVADRLGIRPTKKETNDERDAFRHAYTSARASRIFGSETAWL